RHLQVALQRPLLRLREARGIEVVRRGPFNAETQRTQRKRRENKEKTRRELRHSLRSLWPAGLSGFDFLGLLCAYLCVLCVSALNETPSLLCQSRFMSFRLAVTY